MLAMSSCHAEYSNMPLCHVDAHDQKSNRKRQTVRWTILDLMARDMCGGGPLSAEVREAHDFFFFFVFFVFFFFFSFFLSYFLTFLLSVFLLD